MKSMNTGNAQTGTVLVGAGPVMARDSAGDGEDLGRGGDAETQDHSIAQPDGNRRTAR
jgi:hypothetical protein